MKMFLRCLLWIAVVPAASASIGIGLNDTADIPSEFPRYTVPGRDRDMQSLRELFYMHYFWHPYAAMWDMWMPGSVLWVESPRRMEYTQGIRQTLAARHIDDEGYVSTHQHRGLAHYYGWPFPLWTQGSGMGWHFSLAGIPFGAEFNVFATKSLDGWTLDGTAEPVIDESRGLVMKAHKDTVTVTTPEMTVKSLVAPYIGVEWWNTGLSADAVCCLEWTTKDHPEFSESRRMYFDPEIANPGQIFSMIPIHRIPGWKDTILTRLRLTFQKVKDAQLTIQSIYTAVDSRHPINNFAFIEGCLDYVNWTGDLNFLREQIRRMRTSLRFAINEFQVETQHCVFVPWIGHDGRSGLVVDENGNKTIRQGLGIGGNYYDLLPFGGKSCYATVYCYRALRRMAEIETLIREHPEWNIPTGALTFDPLYLSNLADNVRTVGTEIFWNDRTGRFVSSVDIEGNAWDYGFVFLNLETMFYDFAQDWQKREIMDWLDGSRIVEGDTSLGSDIYHWRFAPRCTTRRNIDYYSWVWSAPEKINWGGQVQDGGAVLAWSYHDIIERIKVNGPDDAWQCLAEILEWFREVQAEGGYRAYYAKPGRGTLQGGGPPGGLGMDKEFVESLLVPRVMLDGFLGITPHADGLRIAPRLPRDWPSLTMTGIVYHGNTLEMTAEQNGAIRVRVDSAEDDTLAFFLPAGTFTVSAEDADGNELAPARTERVRPDRPLRVPCKTGAVIEFTRPDKSPVNRNHK